MDPSSSEFIRIGLVLFFVLIASISIHEWAHAFVADKLGDPLPRALDRVSLNPLVHIDLFGTIILPLIMIFMPIFIGGGIALIGWGKPVSISLPNLQTRTRDDILITAAGPLSNLILATLTAITAGLLIKAFPNFSSQNQLLDLFRIIIQLNVTLFVFNLIPIPPLDGAHFLKHLFKMSEETFFAFSRWGFIIILLLINLSPIRILIWSVISSLILQVNHLITFIVNL